jgi:hypothetical protein
MGAIPPKHGKLLFVRAFETRAGTNYIPIERETLDEMNFSGIKGLIILYEPEVEYTGNDSYVLEFEQGDVKVKSHAFVLIDTRANLSSPIRHDCEVAPGEFREGLNKSLFRKTNLIKSMI